MTSSCFDFGAHFQQLEIKMSSPFDSTLSGSLLPPSRSLEVSQRLLVSPYTPLCSLAYSLFTTTHINHTHTQTMGCPYLEGMEASLVKEVVLTPGGARTRILQWLVGRYEIDSVTIHILRPPTVAIH